jgi:hypothetical protein
MFTSKLVRCLFAGMWFAIAAVIPVAYYFLLFQENGSPQSGLPIFGGSSVLTAGVPVLVAGICSLLLGSAILDAEETKSAVQAIGRGLLVALLSYLLLFTVPAVILAFYTADPVGLLVLFVVIFLYGLLAVGWLVAGVGVVAGWLLYLCRLKAVEGHKKV